jgi:hypothetical protein
MGEADAAVELGVAGQALGDAGHADKQQPELAAFQPAGWHEGQGEAADTERADLIQAVQEPGNSR